MTFGLQDQGGKDWSGSVRITGGESLGIELWRPAMDDAVESKTEWRIATRVLPMFGKAKAKGKGKGAAGPNIGDHGIFLALKGDEQTSVEVNTAQGNFDFKVADLPSAGRLRQLSANASVERVPSTGRISATSTEDDYPAAATERDGTIWVAFQSYTNSTENANTPGPLSEAPTDFSRFKKSGGDRIWLTSCSQGAWSAPIPVTNANRDVYRTAVAVDGRGRVWVIWSENVNGNWDLYARSFTDARGNDIIRLTSEPNSDLNHVVAADRGGNIWVAWQAFRGGQSDIFLAKLNDNGLTTPIRISTSPANDWDPAIAIDSRGNVHIAYDTYDKGDYDVWLVSSANSDSPKRMPVAASLKFEARASVVCDNQDRVWVAWEERGERWGKDSGALIQGPGIPFYARGSDVRVRCFVNGEGHDVPEPSEQFAQGIRTFNSFPRLAQDGSGRIWLFFRHRSQEGFRGNVGTVWWEYATTLNGSKWGDAMLIPNSDGVLTNVPAAALSPTGQLFAIYGTDGRQHRNPGSVKNDVFVAALPRLAAAPSPTLTSTSVSIAATETTSEEEDVRKARSFRSRLDGKQLRILRGEFHRHTEISADGRNDGSLLDMFRYGLDAVKFDWIGNGDHDNGSGREYTWWITHKLSDAFEVENSFVPMFTYERSVAYPDGHRNVMFAYRGVRTLPRLQGGTGQNAAGQDTKMLYAYLRQLDGICAVHTSATTMGTDWRDNDPIAEPVVEIYQGARHSYEVFGAPRTPTEETQIGGYQPAGFIWSAFAKGYRLGFQSSSDHGSTHISYASVFSEAPTREAILEGFKQRHCYAATDNIILDLRCGQRMMGDEFEWQGAPRLQVFARGTSPIARVDIVKDNTYAYTTEPNQQEVSLVWQDNQATPGRTSYYYVRVLQSDGQLAWSSPMWIRLK